MGGHYIAIAACVVLLAFLCRKETRRPNKARLWARLPATVIAVAGLLFLMAPFPWRRQVSATGNGTGPTKTSVRPSGVQAIYWQQQLNAGAMLHLQGRYRNSAATPVKLLLTGFNERLDSVIIPPGQQQSFELKTRPRHIGRAVYTFTVLAKDTLAMEPVPVEVRPLRSLKVLMLAASPDFEHKFLARWLAAQGYVVAIRTAISRDKYSYTYLDTARFPLQRITAAILPAFDVVVADAAALAALSSSERATLQAQVAEKGLGLVIKADSSMMRRRFYDRPFILSAAGNREAHPQSITVLPAGTVGTLPAVQPLYVRSAPGLQPLVQDGAQHWLAATALHGAGRLVCTTLGNTYAWVLAGREEAYQSVWSLLLQSAARVRQQAAQWHIGTAWPQVRRPVPVSLQTSLPQPAAVVNTARVSLSQGAMLPFQWQGVYWPLQAGWQATALPAGDTCWWYAYAEKDWQPLSARAQKQVQHRGMAATASESRAAIPRIWFFIMFLLGAVFLWVEEKLV
ncbi:hypothetical protein LX66_0996 [Chitinophaga japonensis]|uniref:Uncharacterized protein n=2 Tax=Chitinophaga japonensis TaxID=104662 RepID=A0A562TDI1_CHIJA|nr:hypothetical protein LX66_0996 [Chitinophaga japonensis]